MKRTFIMAAFALPLIFASCGEAEETVEDTTDSLVDTLAEELNEEIEETPLAFDGVDAGDYTLYGHSEITAEEAVSVEEMFTQFNETGAFENKVNVSINQVCQKAGCWITFKDTEENDVRVFFRDHFTIPIETAQGTNAVLYGSLNMDTLSVDFHKHLLDDAKEAGQEVAQEEYDAITEDKIEVSFDCESILVSK